MSSNCILEGHHARIFSCSDLHLDFKGNSSIINELSNEYYQNDMLIVAGDIADRLDVFERGLRLLKSKFKVVSFVPGNHDLWCRRTKHSDSLAKLKDIYKICDDIGIERGPIEFSGVIVLPMLGWYSQDFDGKSDSFSDCSGGSVSWADFHMCKWPDFLSLGENNGDDSPSSLASPLPKFFDEMNDFNGAEVLLSKKSAETKVISFSHFAPRVDTLPKLPEQYRWVYKIAGSNLIEKRIRSTGSSLHIFGHTHHNIDCEIDDVRYVQRPLGYPHEVKRLGIEKEFLEVS
eukprot:TRINITY_DN10569_c0_g1_i2.p1 TRINITY_DN10569_c0_g1~~TRINITY_DN10569_c0_g1_i2.p1  ORF type:complete len:289 (-),score=63.80 TRINITY_DN10569_c0_g1_i2:102-968(-)